MMKRALIILLPMLALIVFIAFESLFKKAKFKDWLNITLSIILANTLIYLPTYLILL